MTKMIKICFLYGTTANFPKCLALFLYHPSPLPNWQKSLSRNKQEDLVLYTRPFTFKCIYNYQALLNSIQAS